MLKVVSQMVTNLLKESKSSQTITLVTRSDFLCFSSKSLDNFENLSWRNAVLTSRHFNSCAAAFL